MSRLAFTAVYNQRDAAQKFDGVDNRNLNCGAACCATIERWCKGGVQNLDAIKDWMRGESYSGYLYTSDLQRYLDSRGIPSETLRASSPDEMRRILSHRVSTGRLTILLTAFNLYNDTGGHFVVIDEADDAGVGGGNPWGQSDSAGWPGFRFRWDWYTAWRHVKGQAPAYIITADKGYRGGYIPKVEDWVAEPLPGQMVNVRAEPFLSSPVVARIKDTPYRYTTYTDNGTAVGGITRWHRRAQGGWSHGTLLTKWRKP